MALAANALTTLATVKTELGITGSSLDSRLERLINAASQRIEKYCRRVFYRDDAITEKVIATGFEKIMLSRTPINSITSVAIDGATVTDYEIHNADAGTVFRSGGWGWSAHYVVSASQGRLPGTEEKSITVIYDGGYVTPEQGGTVTLPDDLQEACIELTRFLYLEKSRDLGLTGESIGEWSADYATAANGAMVNGLPATIAAALAPYRRYA